MARISSIFHTPLPQLLGMYWDEALLWWPHVPTIHAETYGLIAKLQGARNE